MEPNKPESNQDQEEAIARATEFWLAYPPDEISRMVRSRLTGIMINLDVMTSAKDKVGLKGGNKEIKRMMIELEGARKAIWKQMVKLVK